MTLDETLILRKLEALQRHERELDEFRSISEADYSSDWKTQRIVERTLQMMVEICADVANHLISEGGLRIGQSLADAFVSLAEAGVLSRQLSERMVKMAGFRNIIVHQYGDIDAAIVVAVLRSHLCDLLEFRDEVVRYLATHGSKA